MSLGGVPFINSRTVVSQGIGIEGKIAIVDIEMLQQSVTVPVVEKCSRDNIHMECTR
jgi:hypothetical protein